MRSIAARSSEDGCPALCEAAAVLAGAYPAAGDGQATPRANTGRA
jgi:hypothetical protein